MSARRYIQRERQKFKRNKGLLKYESVNLKKKKKLYRKHLYKELSVSVNNAVMLVIILMNII